jgi:hypothetical protein
MKRYHVPLGRRADYPHPAPERTAYKSGKGIFDDDTYQVWPSRGAMLQACKMSDRGILGNAPWRPLVK